MDSGQKKVDTIGLVKFFDANKVSFFVFLPTMSIYEESHCKHECGTTDESPLL